MFAFLNHLFGLSWLSALRATGNGMIWDIFRHFCLKITITVR